MDKYRVISLLGEGSFGRVYKAVQNSDSKFVALKVISKRGRSVKELKGLRRECEIQRHLHHPNIIQMLDSFETENEIVVITEFAHVELNAILGKEGYLPEDRVQAIVWDLVSALYYLHSHRVLHRDLKPQNILLDTNNCAKLCDFGFARNMSTGTHVLTSIKGTPLYMAPELIEEQPYDHNADLWSLGCIIYELLVGAPPFCTASILHLIRLIRHEQIQWPSFISENCISFLKGLLQKNPNKRLTWPEILNHPFVRGHILINETAPPMPLTRPMSANTLQIKEQQRKDHFVQRSESQNKNMEENPATNETSNTRTNKSNIKGLEKSVCSESKRHSLDKMATLSLDDTNKEEENFTGGESVKSESTGKKEVSVSETLDNKNLNSQDEAINIHEDSHPIENEEWIVFLHRTIEEVMAGETMSLAQPSLTNIIVSPLRNSSASPKVLGYVANLFSLPFVMRGTSESKLEQIKKVYLEVKLVPNLVYATKLLARSTASNNSTPTPANSPIFPAPHENYKSLMDLTDDDLQALEHIFVLLCYLVHLDVRFLNQFCDAVAVLNIYALLQRFLMLSKKELRIVTDLLAILTQLLRKTPENFELVDRVISRSESKYDSSEERLDFVHMLRHSDCLMSERVCFLLAFLAKTSKKTLEGLWNEKIRETLEALVYDSMENVRNAAEMAVEEIRVLDFYYLSS